MIGNVATFALVGAAVAAPSLLELASSQGVPIPVYVTAGQRAALAAFGGTAVGSTSADTQQFESLLFAGTGKMPSMTSAQAADVAQRLLAACDAGAASPTEPYQVDQTVTDGASLDFITGIANGILAAAGKRTSLGDAYDAVKSMSLFNPEDNDTDLSSALLDLASEMDNQGYLVTGKPPTVTIAGGLDAAAAASAKFVASAAAGAVADAASAAFDLLLTSPVLLGIGALVVGVYVYRSHVA